MPLPDAQAALRESEERYRRIVETTTDGIMCIDEQAAITFVNRRLAEMTGYTVEEMVGQLVTQFVPERNRQRAMMPLERSRQGTSEENEVSLLRRDGSEIWVLVKTSAIRDAGGASHGTLAMMSDRTGRREVEEALRRSEEQYRQIVETTPDGIIKLDDAGVLLFVNGRFAEMLGYQPSEMIGLNASTFMSPAARVMTLQRRAGVQKAVDTTFRHKDGRDIAVNVAGNNIVDVEGKQAGFLAVVRDVTEQKKLQSQLMVSDRMASVGTLAAGVAHEINNPLAAVIANLDFVVETLENIFDGAAGQARNDDWFLEQVRPALDDACDGAQQVRSIVRDLNAFSRSPANEPSTAVDVNASLESSLRMGWNEIRHRARLVKNYGVVPPVLANEARLGQVFLNLVVNAAQAVPEGHAEQNEVAVSTRLEGERVIVEVRDTGAGIPPEIIGRIFDAFFTTKAIGVGTGLGLAICQRIVTDVGGELTVESEVGKGTTFRVSLPIAREAQRAVTAVPEPAPLAGRRGRILIVDDEVLVLNTVRRVLAKEHEVAAVVAASEALELITGGEKFDLILCDLMMPDMTGMELHDELQRMAPEQASRMVFMTGGAFTAKARQFLADTPREHIEKPFDPDNLRSMVQRYLQ